MSDLTNIARPYAKAAFDFAVEQNALDAWLQMLAFAAQVAEKFKGKIGPTGYKTTRLQHYCVLLVLLKSKPTCFFRYVVSNSMSRARTL